MSVDHPVPNHASTVSEIMAVRIVALLLVVAAASVFVVWTTNPVGSGSETTLALFLSVDLISVAMISYVQRSVKNSNGVGRAPLIAGCCFVLFLILADLYLVK